MRRCAIIPALLVLAAVASAVMQHQTTQVSRSGSRARPEPAWEILDAGSLWSAFMNIGWFGDPYSNYPSMEWPGGSGSDYLWLGDVWATCYGEVTPSPAETSWVSNSEYGGDMAYHLFTSDDAVTLKGQHAAANEDGSFADLGGCTSGSIDASAAPVSGFVVTTAKTTTVNRYLRWQIDLGVANTATFALAFVRETRASA